MISTFLPGSIEAFTLVGFLTDGLLKGFLLKTSRSMIDACHPRPRLTLVRLTGPFVHSPFRQGDFLEVRFRQFLYLFVREYLANIRFVFRKSTIWVRSEL